jgi:hypothetical protein
MTTNPETRLRVGGVRATWFAAGVLGLLLHRPWSIGVLLAIGTPWVVGMVLLAGEDTSTRLSLAWRETVARRAGVFGVGRRRDDDAGSSARSHSRRQCAGELWLVIVLSVVRA